MNEFDSVVIGGGSGSQVATAAAEEGLEDVDFLTSDDALYLGERPDELVVIGGGYIAAELGYFFGALGAEVSIVGRTEGELEADGREYESARVSYDAAPLGLILDPDEAFVKVLAESDGEILGCHVVGPQAPRLIQEVVATMNGGGTVDDVANAVHVHPALSEVVYAAFDELAADPYSTAPNWRDVGDE